MDLLHETSLEDLFLIKSNKLTKQSHRKTLVWLYQEYRFIQQTHRKQDLASQQLHCMFQVDLNQITDFYKFSGNKL